MESRTYGFLRGAAPGSAENFERKAGLVCLADPVVHNGTVGIIERLAGQHAVRPGDVMDPAAGTSNVVNRCIGLIIPSAACRPELVISFLFAADVVHAAHVEIHVPAVFFRVADYLGNVRAEPDRQPGITQDFEVIAQRREIAGEEKLVCRGAVVVDRVGAGFHHLPHVVFEGKELRRRLADPLHGAAFGPVFADHPHDVRIAAQLHRVDPVLLAAEKRLFDPRGGEIIAHGFAQ